MNETRSKIGTIIYFMLCMGLVSIKPYAAQAPLSLQEIAQAPPKILTTKEIKAYLATHMRHSTHEERSKLNKLIRTLAAKYGFNPGLILSVIKVESNFNRFAISPVGALGFMQVMPETAEWLAPQCKMDWNTSTSLFDAETNLKLGVCYLSYLNKKFGGDLTKALSAYNQGPAKVSAQLSVGAELALGYYNKVRFHLNELTTRNN